ncbi:MAG: group III truncated hemoglobin [Flavitalea sp.]
MKSDISNRDDIQKLVLTFYGKVKQDQVIGYIFSDVAKVNWEKHLPVMYDFWEHVLFGTGNYSGNPMVTHTRLNEKIPLSAEHFNQWKSIWTSTVDELFEGEIAELAKQRAVSIATVMQIKVTRGNPGINRL